MAALKVLWRWESTSFFLKKGKIEHPVKVFCCTLLFPVLATHTYELEETQEGLIAQCCVVFNLKVHFGACCVDAWNHNYFVLVSRCTNLVTIAFERANCQIIFEMQYGSPDEYWDEEPPVESLEPPTDDLPTAGHSNRRGAEGSPASSSRSSASASGSARPSGTKKP